MDEKAGKRERISSIKCGAGNSQHLEGERSAKASNPEGGPRERHAASRSANQRGVKWVLRSAAMAVRSSLGGMTL